MVYLNFNPYLDHPPKRQILCLDCKSFFASVEAVERGLHPLEAILAVVSRADQRSGLVLASSVQMKKKYGVKTGTRTYEIPNKKDILLVPPRMDKYIAVNRQINSILLRYVAPEDWHPYSIDEAFIDITASYHLEGQPLDLIQRIQANIWDELGLVVAVGLGDNPLLAKLALDLEAKNNHPSYIASWHYEDVPYKLWPLTSLNNIWGIGSKVEARLHKMGIYSMYALAQTDPHRLHKEFGTLGDQLFQHAYGVDYSRIAHKYVPHHKSYSKSQILTRDYTEQREIELVIQEMTDQVAARLRQKGMEATLLSLSIGYSRGIEEKGFSRQCKLEPTNLSYRLLPQALHLFRRHYFGQAVRRIAVSLGQLQAVGHTQLNLFESPHLIEKQAELERTIDQIRLHYGYPSLVRASSLTRGGTAIARANLVGGHRG